MGAVNKFIEISTSLTRLRIFTLALELLIGLAIYLLIRIKTKDFLSAFLGFITFLSLISINKFHVIVRIDYLYILFILLSVYFLVRFKESGKSFLLLYFIIFGTLSIFTKIPAIATFATITLYHFVNYKKESRILISISIIALLCLILFIVTNKVTSGGFYLHTIANQLSKPIDRDTAKTFLADLFVTYRILIFPVIYLLLKYRKYVDPLYLVLFLSSITEATLSIFKLGGDQNYFILPISLLCVVLFSTKRKVYEIYNIVIPICFVLLSIGGYYRWCLTEASYKQNQDFERSFSTIDDEYLLTNNVYPFYKSDRKLFTNDLFQYSINSQVKRQNGVPDIFLRGVKFNYIFTSYYSYVKSVNIFPIDEFELIYETNNNCLKQEIWKRKQAQ